MTPDINNTSLPDTGVEPLLPCPFCGGNFVAQGASQGFISVWCGDCGARGPEVKFPEHCMPGPPVDECRAAWNRRALSARASVAVAVGVKALRTDYLRGQIGEILALELDADEKARATSQAVERILMLVASLTAPVEETVEPVAWQHRILFEDTGKWSEWRWGEATFGIDNRTETRPLYAASTASPSIAGEEARERERCAKIARRLLEGYDTGDEGFGVEEAILSGRPAK